ncbi:hypothetical protein C0Q70_19115 [Pomacea canaliculata]|uniref:Uncharacterized protein n=1 Tax=Pomacea canaliculata TaxID=400727 RepID=A0A2T7NIH0_POMCA|nr:hypothetical protein C0Q70_19115 [Pomacea canaliculata]
MQRICVAEKLKGTPRHWCFRQLPGRPDTCSDAVSIFHRRVPYGLRGSSEQTPASGTALLMINTPRRSTTGALSLAPCGARRSRDRRVGGVFFSPARAVRAVALAEGRAGVALDSTRASSLSVGSA